VGYRGGFPRTIKRERARLLLDDDNPAAALSLLASSCYGAGYDVDYFELLGRALLSCDRIDNAGRFLFLSGVRRPAYGAAITRFLSRNSDPNNFRQLQSSLPKRVRVMWKLAQFPPIVASELRSLGWPEDTQAAIIARKQSRLNEKYTISISKIPDVSKFIQEHQQLIWLLNDAYKELRKYFPSEDLRMELVSDVKIAEKDRLFIYILTSLSESDALNKFDKFDKYWEGYRRELAKESLNFKIRFI
jgi:hypothetical protein